MKRLVICAIALIMAGCGTKDKATGNLLIDKGWYAAEEECDCNYEGCNNQFIVKEAIVCERGVLITVYCSVKCMGKDTEEMLAIFCKANNSTTGVNDNE